MEVWISPKYRNIDFPHGMSLDQKIQVFEDQVMGWQLNIARQCAEKIPHAGFAMLNIVFSYFEMIAKSQDGYIDSKRARESRKYFKKGFKSVFPNLINESPEIVEQLLNTLYINVRCGLYHAGMTGPNIKISPNYSQPIIFAISSGEVQINTYKLVPVLILHFQSYISQLRDPKNEDLRKKFERRYT